MKQSDQPRTWLHKDIQISEHTFLGAAAAFFMEGAFFFPREKVMSILKAATGAMRRAAVASFMVDALCLET